MTKLYQQNDGKVETIFTGVRRPNRKMNKHYEEYSIFTQHQLFEKWLSRVYFS